MHLQALLNGDPHQEKIRGQLATLPIEALQAVRQLRMAGCSKEEKARLLALVRALETLVIRTSQLVSRRQLLGEIAEPKLRLQFECLDVAFKQMLEAFRKCFEQGDCRRPLPALHGALAGLDHAIQQVRNRRRFAGQTPETPLGLLDLVDRHHATAEALDECGRLLGTLQIQHYWGDYAL
jgi:hypothetical protein